MKVTKIFWLIGGLIFTAIGFVGAVLPLIPTTPFLLLAAFCFGKSSKRLENWLNNHPMFGPPLSNWRQHGAISRNAKISAVFVLIATPILTYVFSQNFWIILVQIPFLIGSGTFILTRPSGPVKD